MGTDSGVITKPPIPPKPKCIEGRWYSATDVILKEDGEKTGNQIEVERKCLSVHKATKQEICSAAGEVPDHNVPLISKNSPPLQKPIPKPRLRKPQTHTLPRLADSATNGSVSRKASLSDSSALNSSSESFSVPAACLLTCSCLCHQVSKQAQPHNPAREEYRPVHTGGEDNKGELDSSNNAHEITHLEKPRREPPNIPVPSRPLPKEPQQIIIKDMNYSLNYENYGEYVDIDIPPAALSHSQLGNFTADNNTTPSTPPTKPVPALRKRDKEKIAAQMQSKHLDAPSIFLDNIRNELCRILSGENQENSVEMKKPKVVKNKLVKLLLAKGLRQSSSRKAPQADLRSVPSRKKAQSERRSWVNLKSSARKIKRRESLNSVQNLLFTELKSTLLSQRSPTKSIQAPARNHEKLTDALPSAGLERHGTGNTLNEECKGKDNDCQKVGELESLWQERCIVKESGILSKLTKEEVCLQESIYEVVTSEQSYLDGLNVAVDHFQQSPALNSAIVPRDQKSLFSSLPNIREISQKFMDSMLQKLESSLLCNDICDVVHEYAAGSFGAYVDYIRKMSYQLETFDNLRKESPRVVEILSKLQEDPRCRRLSLESFLSMPFQRMTRLKLLMEAVLKSADPGSDVQASAERALAEISKVLEACNRVVGEMKQMEELLHIATNIEFECKVLPLVSSSRWLVREGDLAYISPKENIFGQKKISSVHLFLFNDLLLVTTRKGTDKYVVQDHVHRSLIDVIEGAKVEEDLEGYDLNKVLQLSLLLNHKEATSHFLLQAASQTERDGWMEVLGGQKGGEDQVYEEWDCPQVKCIEVYHGQQPGELSLQLDDIVNVIRKMSDGYIKGQRLRDGEQGRFPAANVEEIINKHVQRRNIRKRYQVLQTAAREVLRRSGHRKSQTTTCFK